jgi:GntR family transcriptional regulator
MNSSNTKTLSFKPLDRHSPMPLYQQLNDVLADAIREGQVAPGDQLPSENELIALFNVSRYVVRQTLNLLGRQGLIITQRGRGSFVAPKKIDKPIDVLGSYHAVMKHAGMDVDVRILTKKIIRPPEEIASRLALSPNRKVLMLERIAYLGETPLNILVAYIAVGKASEKQLLDFSGSSLYEYLARTCDIHLTCSHNVIEVIFSGADESRLLNIQRGGVLMQITGVSCEQDNTPIEYSRVIYPVQFFRLEFESFIADSGCITKRVLIP